MKPVMLLCCYAAVLSHHITAELSVNADFLVHHVPPPPSFHLSILATRPRRSSPITLSRYAVLRSIAVAIQLTVIAVTFPRLRAMSIDRVI